MKSLAEALLACEAISLAQRAEDTPLREAMGRFLTEPIYAARDTPSWHSSAMDGYAVRWADATQAEPPERPLRYQVGQVIAAGHPPRPLQAGEVARIMTGAPLPPNADTVIIQENVRLITSGLGPLGEQIEVSQPPRRIGEHVRARAEELSQGDLLLDVGRALNPAALALCASQGLSEVSLWARPRVAILSTGDELRAPGEPLALGQIYASNATLLRGLVEEAGGVAIDCGVARDTQEETRAGFERALASQPDLILSSGGVSVGDFDPVKGVLSDLGARLDFWKVRMKPGKPLAVGELAGRPVLALPGNPVSAAVSFLLFARPLIQRALGVAHEDARLRRKRLPLAESLEKQHSRAELMRVHEIETHNGPAWQLSGAQSSAWLTPLERADALLMLPEAPICWEEGTSVEALLLPWAS